MSINKLSSGGMIVGYKCPAACGHCVYGCSTDAQPGYMDEATAAGLWVSGLNPMVVFPNVTSSMKSGNSS